MQAPSVGGVMLPRGNGQSVRLSRGASLTDFAEKINANPASLVAVASHARTGTSRLLLGSVAAEIVGSIISPVIVVPRPDA